MVAPRHAVGETQMWLVQRARATLSHRPVFRLMFVRAVTRQEQKEEEYRIVRELQSEYTAQRERVAEWQRRTGKSQRAFYRRVRELDLKE